MTTFPYDPTTGKPLTAAGYKVRAIRPMTQKEVDAQHALVSNADLCKFSEEDEQELEDI